MTHPPMLRLTGSEVFIFYFVLTRVIIIITFHILDLTVGLEINKKLLDVNQDAMYLLWVDLKAEALGTPSFEKWQQTCSTKIK